MYAHDNELRTAKIEDFLIREAQEAGVVKTSVSKIQKNPNRWAKHLAPWFDTSCKKAKVKYKQIKRKKGKRHPETYAAY